ncbi:hypothetical protein OKW12_002215 [Pseudomonas silensiensis]|nr:hypothetical protein [Pseudomonas silensiensis]
MSVTKRGSYIAIMASRYHLRIINLSEPPRSWAPISTVTLPRDQVGLFCLKETDG